MLEIDWESMMPVGHTVDSWLGVPDPDETDAAEAVDLDGHIAAEASRENPAAHEDGDDPARAPGDHGEDLRLVDTGEAAEGPATDEPSSTDQPTSDRPLTFDASCARAQAAIDQIERHQRTRVNDDARVGQLARWQRADHAETGRHTEQVMAAESPHPSTHQPGDGTRQPAKAN